LVRASTAPTRNPREDTSPSNVGVSRSGGIVSHCQQQMSFIPDVVIAIASSISRATTVILSIIGVISAIHASLQRVKLRMPGFGAITYAVIVVTFCMEMLRHLDAFVWPVSGFGSYDDDQIARGCRALRDIGPIHILRMQFICNSLLFAPILLLPPVPEAAQKLLHSFELALGSKLISKLALRLRKHAQVVVSLYLLLCAWTLSHVVTVYMFAKVHQNELVAMESDTWTYLQEKADWISVHLGIELPNITVNGTATPFYDARSDDTLAMMTGFIYVILAWAKLIIVYERLTARCFSQDFPRTVLGTAFPCLRNSQVLFGRLPAAASGLGKLRPLANRAFTIITVSPVYTLRTRGLVEQHLHSVDIKIAEVGLQLRSHASVTTESFLDQALAEFKKAAATATETALRSLQDSLTSASLGHGGSRDANPSSSRFLPSCVGVAATTHVSGRDANGPCTGSGSPSSCVTRSPAEFYAHTRALLRDLEPPLQVGGSDLYHGLLPGDKYFLSNISTLAQEAIEAFFEVAQAEKGRYLEQPVDWVIELLMAELRQLVSGVRQGIMAPMDEYLGEVRDLAYHSDEPKAAVDSAFRTTGISVKALQEDVESMEAEAQRLVDVAAMFPVLQSQGWAWLFYLGGLVLMIVTTRCTLATISAIILLREYCTLWQLIYLVIMALPFTSLFAFITYFWFLSFTGQLIVQQDIRGGYISMHRIKYDESKDQLTGRADVTHDSKSTRCWVWVGILFPAIAFLAAMVYIGLELAEAVQAPMSERCLDLINGLGGNSMHIVSFS